MTEQSFTKESTVNDTTARIVARYTFEADAVSSVRARNLEAGSPAFTMEHDASTDTYIVKEERAPMYETEKAQAISEAIAQEVNCWMPSYGRTVVAIARLIATTGDAAWLDERADLLIDRAGLDVEEVDEDAYDVAVNGLRAIADGAWCDDSGTDDTYSLAAYEATSYGLTCYASDTLAPRDLTMADLCGAFGGDVVAAARALVNGMSSLYGIDR